MLLILLFKKTLREILFIFNSAHTLCFKQILTRISKNLAVKP